MGLSISENKAITGMPRSKKLQNGSTKDRLLRAGMEVFAKKGFHGASTREITQLARTNLSGLHFHWRSKRELYIAVHRVLFQLWTEVALEVVNLLEQGLRSSMSLEEVMGPVTDRVFDFFEANQRLARLNLHRVLDDGRLTARIEKEFENPLYHAIGLCFRRLSEQGLIKVSEPELLPFSLETLMDHYFASPSHVERSLGVEGQQLRVRMRNHFRETFLRMLK